MERFISDKLGRGEFRSADEMMCAALQRMVEVEMAHTEALLREAEESGEYIELNDTVWTTIGQEAFQEAERRKEAKVGVRHSDPSEGQARSHAHHCLPD
jgi:Arc/MetJ-type ribon-helix-helix transcriptional regulator